MTRLYSSNDHAFAAVGRDLFDRRRFVQGGAAALLGACSSSASDIQRHTPDLVIENVSIVPMHADRVDYARAVVVDDGVITAIRLNAETKDLAPRRRVDGRGLHLMPALADLHVHVEGEPERDFPLYLANGVTTVRNMSDRDFDHLRIRREVRTGTLEGPRFLLSGPSLHQGVLATVEAVGPLLDRHRAVGYDTVKIHGDLAPDVYDALIDGAALRNLRVSGHVQRRRSLATALRMDSIEHAEEFLYVPGREVLADPARADATARQVAESGAYLCPTLVVFEAIGSYLDDTQFTEIRSRPELAYLPEAVRELWLSETTNPYRARVHSEAVRARLIADMSLLLTFTRRLHEAGTPLILGTDALGALVPGFSVHQELALLVRAGLTPYQALRTATVNAAAFLGEREVWGTVEPGKAADLILVEGNPLRDITNAARIRGLSSQGRWYDRADLVALLQRVRARPDPSLSNYSTDR